MRSFAEAVRLGEEREQGLVGCGCRRFPSHSAPRFRLLADGDAVLEQLVVDEPGAADRLDEELGLCRRRVKPIFVAFQHVRPSSLQQIVMYPPRPIPADGEGESDGITNFCSSYLSQGEKTFGPGDSSPTYAGLRPETLKGGRILTYFC